MSGMTGRVVAESLRRQANEATMSDTDFKVLLEAWIASLPPNTADPVEELKYCWKGLVSGLFAIRPFIDNPYPDDPRWTPYTRFIERYEQRIDEILRQLPDTSPQKKNL